MLIGKELRRSQCCLKMSLSNSPQKQPQDASATAASNLCALGQRLVASSKRGHEVALSPHELKAARRAANLLLDAAERQATTEADRAYNSWSGSGAELLSLFALAVRRSSTSLYPDASNEDLQAYDQLRRGLCTELRLLTTAARDLRHTALLSGLGCALLRTEVLQAYSRLAADAADALRPAARAACADLPQPQGFTNAVTELLVAMGRAQPTGAVSPRVLSTALRLVDEVLLLLDVLCACRGRADAVSAEYMVRVLQPQVTDGADGSSPGAGVVTPGGVAGEGRGLEPRAYEEALWQNACQVNLGELYSHTLRLLLLATAATRGSAAHRQTHELAGKAMQGLWYRLAYLNAAVLVIQSMGTMEYGVVISELVRLCGALDGGGTAYGMAPGLWPQPPWAGEGGAEWLSSKEYGASKALLAFVVKQWGAVLDGRTLEKITQRDLRPIVADLAQRLSMIQSDFRSVEEELQVKGNRKLMQRRLVEERASLGVAASQLLPDTDTMCEALAFNGVPPLNPFAAGELCLRLARGLLAGRTGQQGLAGGTGQPAEAGSSGAPAPAAGPPAKGVRGGLPCTSTATASPSAPTGDGDAVEAAGPEGAGAEAGAAAAGSVTGGAADQGIQRAVRLQRALDEALLHAALQTGRAAWLYADAVDLPGDRMAHCRRALALLRGWWRVFVAAARQGLAPPPDADTGGTAECAASPPEGLRPAAPPKRPSADAAAALAAGLLPCCAELLRGGGQEGCGGGRADGNASGGGTGSSGGGGSSAQGAASSSTAADSPVTSEANERTVCPSPGSLEDSPHLGLLLRCLRMCSWPQLLAFGGRGEVRQLTSALAWRLGWQVEMLRGAAEAAGRQGSVGAGLVLEAALKCAEVNELLMFVSCRLEDVLWLRGQVGRGRDGGEEQAGGASGRSKGSSVGVADDRTAAAPGAGSEATSGAPGAGAAVGGAAPGGEAGVNGAGASKGAEGAGGGGSGGATATGQAVEGSGCHASACGSGTAGSSAGGEAASAAASDGGDKRVAECMLAAAPLWHALSELLPAASRAVVECVELLLPEGVGGRAGAGAAAAARLQDPEADQLTHGICSSCVSVLRCASLLLVAHVGAGEAGMAHSPWRGVLLGEVGLLGAGVRLWVQAGAGAGAEEGKQQPGSSEQQLQELLASVLFVVALAFPAELRAGVQDGEGAAGAEAGSEGTSTSGGPSAPPCRMRLSALRAVLGASGGAGVGGQGQLGEMEVVCRVAGGWEPEPGERRALLQRGCRRLVGAVWRGETEGRRKTV